MFALSTVLISSALLLRSVAADPTPSEPAPKEVYQVGKTCHISWEPDTTGQWTTMNIELMTGSNPAMEHLTTVASLDGTSKSTTSFDYPCPDVTLYSTVYFYQFTSPASSNITWTGRFAISDANGKTVAPPNTDDGIQWGSGALKDASAASAAPSYLGTSTSGASNSTTSTSSKSIPTTTASGVTVSTTASGLKTVKSAATGSTTSGAAAAGVTQSPGSTAANTNGAIGGGLDGVKGAFVALTVVAGTFAAFF